MKWYLNIPADQIPGMTTKNIAQSTPVPAALALGSLAARAIIAIKTGYQVVCRKSEYYSNVRQAIINQVELWIANKDPMLAQSGINEIERLDKLFGPA